MAAVPIELHAGAVLCGWQTPSVPEKTKFGGFENLFVHAEKVIDSVRWQIADGSFWHLADNPAAPAFVRFWGAADNVRNWRPLAHRRY